MFIGHVIMLINMYVWECCFFFFKQKTAYEMRISDWSSDVCSSDLHEAGLVVIVEIPTDIDPALRLVVEALQCRRLDRIDGQAAAIFHDPDNAVAGRSEERRVGKECVSTCRSRWSPYHYKKNQRSYT